MEELSLKSPAMANTFAGNKKRLLNRVKRMIQPVGTRFRPAEGLAIILVLVTLALLLGAGANLNTLKASSAFEAGTPAINPDAISTFSGIHGQIGNQGSAAGTTDAFDKGANEQNRHFSAGSLFIPDTTKKAGEKDAVREEEAAVAKEEALAKIKDAMAQREEARKAYQEAMQEYQEIIVDIQMDKMDQWNDRVKWVVKIDSLDSAGVIVMPRMSKMMFFSEDEFEDLAEPELFFDCPEPGKYEYSYQFSHPKKMEIIKELEGAEIVVKSFNDDGFRRNEDKEIELRILENELKGRQRDIEREIIVSPDVRVHHSPREPFIFMDNEKDPEHYIRQELIEDRLIFRGRDYIVELNTNSMYINGEKQPKEVFKKYKKLYEGVSEQTLDVSVKMIF